MRGPARFVWISGMVDETTEDHGLRLSAGMSVFVDWDAGDGPRELVSDELPVHQFQGVPGSVDQQLPHAAGLVFPVGTAIAFQRLWQLVVAPRASEEIGKPAVQLLPVSIVEAASGMPSLLAQLVAEEDVHVLVLQK